MSFEKDRNIKPPRKRGFNIPYVIIPGIEKPKPVGPVRPNATKRLAMEAEKKKVEEEAKKTEKEKKEE